MKIVGLIILLFLFSISFSLEYKIKKVGDEIEIFIWNDENEEKHVLIKAGDEIIINEKFQPRKKVYELIYLPNVELSNIKIFVDGKQINKKVEKNPHELQIFLLIISFFLGFFFYLSLGFLKNIKKT